MPSNTRFASLYVHVPFCRRKCAYCDFYSLPEPGDAAIDAYLDALTTELKPAADLAAPLHTLYLGGGTPTALPVRQIARIFRVISERFDLGQLVECTVEANPATVDADRTAVLADSPATRISLGAQSFDPPTLAVLGRIHGPDDIDLAVDRLRAAGLEEISLDLIFGVPGQTVEHCVGDVDHALALAPAHISAYGLSIPSGTPLARRVAEGRMQPVPDDDYVAMAAAVRERILAAGFEHYEISNFARPGHRSRHNLVYWHNEPYRGVGPAAASFVGGRRWTNVADLDAYARRLAAGEAPVAEAETLPPEQRARETAMLGLRLLDGLDLAAFRRRTGFDLPTLFGEAYHEHLAAGRLALDGGRVRLTAAALPVADSVLADVVG